MGIRISKDHLHPSVIESITSLIGDLSQLETTAKGNAVEAINELLANGGNKEELEALIAEITEGKKLIATSIGNPLITGNSTFNAMSEAILALRRESENETDAREVLYNMMLEDGYNEANSEMSVDELIDLLDRSGIEIEDIKQIACGDDHTVILKNDGSLWATGDNGYGELGLGDNTNKTTFTKVTTNINNDVKQIACGESHTFILKNDGSVWSCGSNNDGQLGSGDTISRNTFAQVTTNINNDVKQIACGYGHTVILKNDGSIWGCGYNKYGQLGLNDDTNRTTFTQVTTNINNDVKQVACGGNYTFIVKTNGSVWACGYNNYGQLGLNNTNSKDTFTQVTTNIYNDVKQIVCGGYYTCILKKDGSVWACGYNNYGQLGLNDTTDRTTFTKVNTNINNDVKQIACGLNHTFIIKNDGSIWSCGINGNGQLGLGNTTSKTTFTKVTTNINNDVKQIACGSYYTFILKNDGSIWSCGNNYYGQLGLNDKTDRKTFTNTNFSTGLSEYDIDRLALYNYLLDNDIEVTEDMDIGTMLDLLVGDYINNMILGYENNLRIILTEEGVTVTEEDDMDSLISKTDNEFDTNRNRLYELMSGGGYAVNSDMSMDRLLEILELSGINVRDIKQIACGSYHTIILKNDCSVWTCGRNAYGQLGLGTSGSSANETIFTKVTKNINNDVKQVACGNSHTFILKNDGSVWSCGANALGLGDTNTYSTFTKVTTNINNDVKQISCGGDNTFILKNDGSVWSCGFNGSGELGLGNTTKRTTFTQVTTNINNDVKQIACGDDHTVILKNDGSVWSCGKNDKGQLGLGNTTTKKSFTQVTTNINNNVKQIACGEEHTFIIKNDGSVWSCGDNSYGQLGLGTSGSSANKTTFTKVTTNINNDVKQIVCGYQHTFILKNDGSIWSCGSNDYGELGLNDDTNRTTFTQVTKNINNDIKQIACGHNYTFIIKNEGSVWSCGYNTEGQLGLGTSGVSNNEITFTMIPRGPY